MDRPSDLGQLKSGEWGQLQDLVDRFEQACDLISHQFALGDQGFLGLCVAKELGGKGQGPRVPRFSNALSIPTSIATPD